MSSVPSVLFASQEDHSSGGGRSLDVEDKVAGARGILRHITTPRIIPNGGSVLRTLGTHEQLADPVHCDYQRREEEKNEKTRGVIRTSFLR